MYARVEEYIVMVSVYVICMCCSLGFMTQVDAYIFICIIDEMTYMSEYDTIYPRPLGV